MPPARGSRHFSPEHPPGKCFGWALLFSLSLLPSAGSAPKLLLFSAAASGRVFPFFPKEPDATCMNKKTLYRRIFRLSVPIVLSRLLDSCVYCADVLMTNYVGQEALSASSLAGQYCTIALMFFAGIEAGAIMLGSQYWGKKDLSTVQSVQALALRLSLCVGAVLSAAFLVMPELLMRVFTPEEQLITLGARYLRIVSPGILFWCVSAVFSASLQTVERVRECTLIKFLTLGCNVLLNAVFIFGLLGAPKLGIAGIALATSLSKLLELLLCVLISARSRDVKLRFLAAFRRGGPLGKDFMKRALPAMANEVVWGLAYSVYPAIFGRFGSDMVAANSIVSVVRNLGAVFCYSIGSATGLILGQYLGRNEIEEAKEASRHLLLLTVATGVLGGVVIFLLKKPALAFANITAESLSLLEFMLNINCFYLMGSALNTFFIVGVFRSGGDSRFGLICDIVDMWCYAVPLGLLSAFVFKLPARVVYVLLCTDEFVKWPWVIRHYLRGGWAVNITRGEKELES